MCESSLEGGSVRLCTPLLQLPPRTRMIFRLNVHKGGRCVKKQEQWEAKRKLVSGSEHKWRLLPAHGLWPRWGGCVTELPPLTAGIPEYHPGKIFRLCKILQSGACLPGNVSQCCPHCVLEHFNNANALPTRSSSK